MTAPPLALVDVTKRYESGGGGPVTALANVDFAAVRSTDGDDPGRFARRLANRLRYGFGRHEVPRRE